MARLEDEANISLHGEDGTAEYIAVSMGIAYKIDDDPLYMVKIPVEDGEVQPEDTVMTNGDHTEDFPDERIPQAALKDGVDWYNENHADDY